MGNSRILVIAEILVKFVISVIRVAMVRSTIVAIGSINTSNSGGPGSITRSSHKHSSYNFALPLLGEEKSEEVAGSERFLSRTGLDDKGSGCRVQGLDDEDDDADARG